MRSGARHDLRVLCVLRVSLAVVLSCAAVGCDEPANEGAPPDTFIALGRDFEGFRDWHRFAVAGEAIPEGAAPGPPFVYARDLPPAGTARFPVGSMFVKTIESGGPTEWTIHAMAKRDGAFNPTGAVGWEYFELKITATDQIAILWRGEGPPSGHGYGALGRDSGGVDGGLPPLVCNDCHSAAWTNDGILTPELSLAP